MTYQYKRPVNLVELIEDSVEKFRDYPLIGSKDKSGEYRWMTYGEAGTRIDNLRGGLAKAGVKKKDGVGIIANNREEWPIAAFATYGLGARFIPMYENELEKIWKYIINDGGIKVLLVSTPEIYEAVLKFKDETPGLETVFLIEGQGEHTMDGLEKLGQEHPVPSVKPAPEDVAVLIYTSGTTGNPKGVLLTHGNFTTNFQAGGSLFPEIDPKGRSLCILPWAHSFGQTAELYNFIWLGASMGLMEDVTTVAQDMAKVKPTFMIAVPRVFNKIYDGLWAKMNETGGLARKLFVMGVESAKKKRELAQKGESDFFTNFKFKIADKIVFKKIRQRFGGRLKGAVSGSATMNVEISHFFNDIGIPVYDCYGLTETSPAVTMNCPAAHKAGSVGKPIQDVRVEIEKVFGHKDADDGEIVVYGPNVMKGYHNNPDATRQVMTHDGGFRTGDRGRLDKDGYLFITGRIKEQYKLENGKYVFPTSIEEEIKLCPWIENAMVYGDGKPYNVCLMVPDFAVLATWAKQNSRDDHPEALVNDTGVQQMITQDVTKGLEGKFGRYEIPRKFIWLADNFSLENGMLTQTMKLKRKGVLDQYMDRIDTLYLEK